MSRKSATEVRKELEGYEAQRMAVKKAIMTPYEQFEAVYKECVSTPYKAADEALGKKIADVEAGIKQQKEDDVRAFFTELTSGFGLDWLKFEQMNLKVTLTCTPKAMKAALTQSVTKIVRDCAALEENPDRDEIMVEYQKSLDPGSACQIVQQRQSSWKPSAALPKNAAPASRPSRKPKLRPRQPLRRRSRQAGRLAARPAARGRYTPPAGGKPRTDTGSRHNARCRPHREEISCQVRCDGHAAAAESTESIHGKGRYGLHQLCR